MSFLAAISITVLSNGVIFMASYLGGQVWARGTSDTTLMRLRLERMNAHESLVELLNQKGAPKPFITPARALLRVDADDRVHSGGVSSAAFEGLALEALESHVLSGAVERALSGEGFAERHERFAALVGVLDARVLVRADQPERLTAQLLA